jgi:2,4-dienoyl-CoA reductase-like NADH-dependent reductase (Old Yellow Enzyme family)
MFFDFDSFVGVGWVREREREIWLTSQMMWGNEGPKDEEKSDRTKAREAFFLEFAKVIRKEFQDVPLMVTGGFSSRTGMERAVADGDCDLVGLGRPAVLNPSVPNSIMFIPEVKDEDATVHRRKIEIPRVLKLLNMQAIGAGMDSVSCNLQGRHHD